MEGRNDFLGGEVGYGECGRCGGGSVGSAAGEVWAVRRGGGDIPGLPTSI